MNIFSSSKDNNIAVYTVAKNSLYFECLAVGQKDTTAASGIGGFF